MILSIDDNPKCKLNMGFIEGPELPDSFFEPLPEEDLQAWGLYGENEIKELQVVGAE